VAPDTPSEDAIPEQFAHDNAKEALLSWGKHSTTRPEVCRAIQRSVAQADLLVAALRRRLAQVEQDNTKMHDELAGIAAGTLTIEHLLIERGNMTAAFGGEILRILGDALVLWFRETGATNYVEARVRHKASGDEYMLTVQKALAKTPHECRRRAEQERDEARRLAEAGRDHGYMCGHYNIAEYLSDYQKRNPLPWEVASASGTEQNKERT